MRYEAKVCLTAADFVTGYRMHCRQSNDIWKVYAIGGVLLIIVFGIAAYLMKLSDLGFIGPVCAFAGCFGFLSHERSIRLQAKRSAGEEVAYVFSEDGVEFTSRTTHSKLPWSYFKMVRIDERGLVLYAQDLSYSFIPARAFASGHFHREEMKAFLALRLKNA